MLNLNLLTPQAKQIIAYERYRRAVLGIGLLLASVLVIFGVLLLPTFFFVTFHEQELRRELDLELASAARARLATLESAIGEINSLAKKILYSTSSGSRLYPILAEVISSWPDGVSLKSLRFTAETKTINLNGHAQSRQVLLEAVRRLRQNPKVENVTSPVSNIIREADFDFNLVIKIR